MVKNTTAQLNNPMLSPEKHVHKYHSRCSGNHFVESIQKRQKMKRTEHETKPYFRHNLAKIIARACKDNYRFLSSLASM